MSSAFAMKYQELALKRQDNENVRNYINETLTTIQQDGFIKTGAVDDIRKIIDLSKNIPELIISGRLPSLPAQFPVPMQSL
jgi:hypothetical protein